jgi:hypothetical protein
MQVGKLLVQVPLHLTPLAMLVPYFTPTANGTSLATMVLHLPDQNA